MQNQEVEKSIQLPDWAISDEEVMQALPHTGFIHDHVQYGCRATDAPTIYHYATACSILSQTLSHADIRVYTEAGEKRGNYHELTTPLWTAVIGHSGDRKSFAMSLGTRILFRAAGRDMLLPTDGSLEGWVDFMAENPNTLVYREELSTLFVQSRKSYLEGLKDLFLTLHSGELYSRRLSQRGKRGSGKGEEPQEDSGGRSARSAKNGDDASQDLSKVVIERPRLSILGAIPPEVFRSRGDRLDWSSGFFARFFFAPGIRTREKDFPEREDRAELELAKWLSTVPRKVQGYIHIPPNATEIIMRWYKKHISPLRFSVQDSAFSHFSRHQELAVRLTALIAVSALPLDFPAGEKVLATPEHAKKACEFLTHLKEASLYLFSALTKTSSRQEEDDILELFMKNPKDWFTLNDLDRMFPDRSRRAVAQLCREWYAEDRLKMKKIRKKSRESGPKRIAYKYGGE